MVAAEQLDSVSQELAVGPDYAAKAPGKPPLTHKPFVLPQGSTVTGFARSVHKELLQQMQYARIWGAGKYDGQRVPRDYELQDMDVVEIRT